MHASTFMRVSIPIAIILTGLSVYSCVETIDPPPPTVQGQVAIPERIYVRARSDSRICSRLFDGDVPVDGGADEPPVDTAYNCYFNVSPPDGGSLPVDVHEVTNLQYQLCYDSGACRGPNPADVDKGAVCQSEDSFDQCPVVGVTYQQAQDYCEWVGRRLPTNLEQILIRQVGLNTKDQNFPLEVPILPTNEPIPQVCSDGVIANGGCNRPFPVMSGDVVPIKAPRLTENPLFDLVGNVSELVADLSPEQGQIPQIPWFCLSLIVEEGGVDTNCPEDNICAYGTTQDGDGTITEKVPICTVSNSPTAGFYPVVVGASYADTLDSGGLDNLPNSTFSARGLAGVYGRRVLGDEGPDRFASTETGQRVGFRCVGQRIQPREDFADTLIIQNEQ